MQMSRHEKGRLETSRDAIFSLVSLSPHRPILRAMLLLAIPELASGSFRSSNLFFANESDSLCQSQELQNTNAIPVDINFIPG